MAVFIIVALLGLVQFGYHVDAFVIGDNTLVPRSPNLWNCLKCNDYRMAGDFMNCGQCASYGAAPGAFGHKRLRGSQFITINKEEAAQIGYCIAYSKNRLVQKKADMCISLEPAQIRVQIDRCNTKLGGGTGFGFYDAFVARPGLIEQLIQCVGDNTLEYTPVELKQRIEVEECIKELYANTCGHRTFF